MVEKQIKKDPFNIDSKFKLAHIYEQTNRQSLANETYLKLIDNLAPVQSRIQTLGKLFTTEGKYDFALQTYTRGKKITKGGYQFNIELAEIYTFKSMDREMILEYLNLIDYSHSYMRTVQTYLSRAIDFDEDNTKVAILKEELLIKIQNDPSNHYYGEMLIWMYLQQKQFSGAIIQAKALDKRTNQKGKKVYEIANICLKNKSYTNARKAYKYIIELGRTSPYYTQSVQNNLEVSFLEITEKGSFSKVDINQVAVDYENALKYLKLALESNPGEDTLLFEIAYFYEELNKHEECIEFYKKFLDENPYSFNGWYNLGIVYNELKQYKKAVSAFDYATLIKDDFTSAYFNKGNAHFNLCEYGEALECYYKTFELEDNQPITFCYVGECYEKMENYVEAEKSFELALTLNEDIQEALIGMAIIKDKQGYTQDALPFVKKANRLYPKSSSCWYIAAEVYNKLNLFDEAYLAYSKADEFNSDNNVQIILDFSNFMAENLSIIESIDYLEKCENPRAQYRLVAYYLLLNKGKAAFIQLEKALSLDFDLHKELLDYHEEIMELPEFISLIEGFKS